MAAGSRRARGRRAVRTGHGRESGRRDGSRGGASASPPILAAVNAASEPNGYMVVSDSGDRIHFLDWGGERGPGIVLVHGLATSAWAWTAVARRLVGPTAGARRTFAMDLRGHGLSDAPTADRKSTRLNSRHLGI